MERIWITIPSAMHSSAWILFQVVLGVEVHSGLLLLECFHTVTLQVLSEVLKGPFGQGVVGLHFSAMDGNRRMHQSNSRAMHWYSNQTCQTSRSLAVTTLKVLMHHYRASSQTA
jgi:hypothetical protein